MITVFILITIYVTLKVDKFLNALTDNKENRLVKGKELL